MTMTFVADREVWKVKYLYHKNFVMPSVHFFFDRFFSIFEQLTRDYTKIKMYERVALLLFMLTGVSALERKHLACFYRDSLK